MTTIPTGIQIPLRIIRIIQGVLGNGSWEKKNGVENNFSVFAKKTVFTFFCSPWYDILFPWMSCHAVSGM